MGLAVTISILVINEILKRVIIAGISWVGEDTNSEQLSSVTNGVFIAQFFNTGILLLLVNGNMSEHWPYALTKYFKGRYYDYYPSWYKNVGLKISMTMAINAFLPYSGLVSSLVVPGIFRLLDRKFQSNIYVTKKTSMAQYKQLYSGAEYVIHFKYSNILNIVYITCMYGIGMPILFVIAAINFFNQYMCERAIVAWCMKQPPALDDKLTNNSLEMLKYAPLLMLFNGFWMISNPQIFQNEHSPIPRRGMSMESNHLFDI